jgi:hypothetical protein
LKSRLQGQAPGRNWQNPSRKVLAVRKEDLKVNWIQLRPTEAVNPDRYEVSQQIDLQKGLAHSHIESASNRHKSLNGNGAGK